MNKIIEKDKIIIENMIYEISGKQVMLDSDLARLYNCKNGTKEINQAVKNNIEKFPERYTWRLTDQESSSFLVKSFDQKIETRGGRYKKPRVFTEQGVAMLATVLKSKIAAEISIRIMDAFVAMRHHISSNLLDPIYYNEERISRLETKYIEHDTEIKLLQESFNKMSEKVKNNHLFYDGQVYDAYSLMIDIFNLSKKVLL